MLALHTLSLGTTESQQTSLESGDTGRLGPPVVETKETLDEDHRHNWKRSVINF